MCNNSYSCHGAGVFLMGAVAGMAAGAALSATMTPSSTRKMQDLATSFSNFQEILALRRTF